MLAYSLDDGRQPHIYSDSLGRFAGASQRIG